MNAIRAETDNKKLQDLKPKRIIVKGEWTVGEQPKQVITDIIKL